MELILQLNGKDHILSITDTNDKILNAFTETKSPFVKITGHTVKVDNSFFKDTKVPDCLFIIQDNKHGKLEADRIKNNKIILILESPHKAEYEKVTFKPLYPASGKTGERISNYFNEISSKMKIEKSHEIIICNPVQWQSSLHELHKKSLTGEFRELRDKVWRCLWDVSHEDFLKRLSKYNPKIIINGCTKKLSPVVQKSLDKNFQDTKRYITTHPSSWWSSKNRNITES